MNTYKLLSDITFVKVKFSEEYEKGILKIFNDKKELIAKILIIKNNFKNTYSLNLFEANNLEGQTIDKNGNSIFVSEEEVNKVLEEIQSKYKENIKIKDNDLYFLICTSYNKTEFGSLILRNNWIEQAQTFDILLENIKKWNIKLYTFDISNIKENKISNIFEGEMEIGCPIHIRFVKY